MQSTYQSSTIPQLISWIHSPSIQRICLSNIFGVRSDVANHSGRNTFRQTLHPVSYPRWTSHAGQKHETTILFALKRARGEERDKGEGRTADLGGWLCDTRATPANGRAEPGRQTIDICVQNGRQERHPPHSTSPFAPFYVYRLNPPFHPHPPPFPSQNPSSHPQASPPSSSLHPSHVCPRSSLTSEPSHWLPTSQYYPCRPRGCSLSLVLSWIHPPLPSRLLSFIFCSSLSTFFISLDAFLLFFSSRISVLFTCNVNGLGPYPQK